MKKQTFRNILFFLICCVLWGCNNQDPLLGKWERLGDEYEGMVISVVKEGDSFKSIIISLPESAEIDGFGVGDTKWKNIKPTADNKYEVEDLAVGGIFSQMDSYVLSNVEMISKNELKIRVFSKNSVSDHYEQKWKRIIEK